VSKLTIPQAALKRDDARSSYNHNFYEIPFFIDGSNTLYGVSDDDCETLWYLETTDDMKFIGTSDIRTNHDQIEVDIEIESVYPT
jgi:hypothetical protein